MIEEPVSGQYPSQEAYKRNLALYLYQQAYQEVGQPLPEGWLDQFLNMWNSEVQNSFELPPTPPGGWKQFNIHLGGIPWHGAYDHTTMPDKDRSFPVGHPARYGK